MDLSTIVTAMRRLSIGILCCFFAILIKEISGLRCYECNPSAGYSVAGSYSSSSVSATSGSSTDCYSPDTRQIKDCAWDIQSCYTVVLPGPQSTTAGAGWLMAGNSLFHVYQYKDQLRLQ